MGSAGENPSGIPPKILSSGRYDRPYRGGRYYFFAGGNSRTVFMVGSMGLDRDPQISDQRIPL